MVRHYYKLQQRPHSDHSDFSDFGAAQNELLELPFLKVVNVSVNLFLKAFFYKILQYSAENK